MYGEVGNTEEESPGEEEGAEGGKKEVDDVGDTERPRRHYGDGVLNGRV